VTKERIAMIQDDEPRAPDFSLTDTNGREVRLSAVVDRDGRVRYRHYGESMHDIASNDTVLAVLDADAAADAAGGRKDR
jgi:peroxiredoxin